MTEHSFTIRRLKPAEARSRVGELADILLDCVAGGASVSFMADLTRDEAVRFWTGVAEGVADGQRILLVGEEAGRLIGTVQVVASGTPNQPHRADLAKMLVHRNGRNKGIGAALLARAEQAAREAGWWMMVLDTVEDSAGEKLYTRAGWRRAGLIPNYALWPDGGLCGTVYFYKDLRPQPALQITLETPDQPEVKQFLEASEAYSAALYPPESNHMLDLSQLLDPAVRFFVARRGGVALGCGSILLGQEHGELKRFFVADAARGQGVGAGLIAAVEQEAREAGISLLRLETGVYSAPALALYRKAGFVPRTAFAPYQPDPQSVFMEKRL
ncbi:MAG: GNAT family N-acetyltransferase [Bosea sp. (in: a-proteobacteria)]